MNVVTQLDRKNHHKIFPPAWVRVFTLMFIMFSTLTCAVDNPDAPDLIAAFQTREKPLLAAAENPENGYRASLSAYTDYLEFLDKELNAVYQRLRSKLPEVKQELLKQSQANWLKYRDAELSFVEETWTKADFGSSSSIARGQFKVSVVRNRIIQLMHYAKAH